METKNLGTFSLFISSTFIDFSLERQILEERVFPKVTDIAARSGLSFEAVDLRWGVTSADRDSNRIIEVCLEEVERCKDSMERPSFLVMLGDRFGWTPPLEKMPEPILGRFLEWAGRRSPEERAFIASMYSQRDEKAIPKMVGLGPSGSEEQDKLSALLFEFGPELERTAPELAQLIGRSATGYEVWASLLKDGEGEHAIFVDRRIKASDLLSESAAPYRDSHPHLTNEEVIELLDGLKADVAGCPGITSHRFEDVKLRELEDPLSNYAEQFAAVVEKSLVEQVEQWIRHNLRRPSASPQKNFALVNACGTECRESESKLLDGLVERSLREDDSRPILIHGEQGAGVTSFLARWVRDGEVRHETPFLSWFPQAVHGEDRSKLDRAFSAMAEGLHRTGAHPDYEHRPLERLLLRASNGEGLIVVIDDLTAISGWEDLNYPTHLPRGTTIVISVQSKELEAVSAVCEHEVLSIGDLNIGDVERIAGEAALRPKSPWFGEMDRASGREVIAGAGCSIGGALSIGEAWRRGHARVVSADEAVEVLLDEAEAHSGRELVGAAMSLLLASERTGISVGEARAALVRDPAVVKVLEMRRESGEAAVSGELPLASWSRLMAPFSWGIRARAQDGTRVLSLSAHELRQAVLRRYATGSDMNAFIKGRLQLLLDVLQEQDDQKVERGGLGVYRTYPNRRKLARINRLMLELGHRNEVVNRCLDLTTIEDRLRAASLGSVRKELAEVIEELEEVADLDPTIHDVYQCFKRSRSEFAEHPGCVTSTVLSRLDRNSREKCLAAIRAGERRKGAQVLLPENRAARELTEGTRTHPLFVFGGYQGLSLLPSGSIHLRDRSGRNLIVSDDGSQIQRENRVRRDGLWLSTLVTARQTGAWLGEVGDGSGPYDVDQTIVSGTSTTSEVTDWTDPIMDHLARCADCKQPGYAEDDHLTTNVIAISPDGRRGAIGLLFHTLVCDLEEGSVLCEVDNPGRMSWETRPENASFSETADLLALRTPQNEIAVYSTESGVRLAECVGPSGDGTLLFVGDTPWLVTDQWVFWPEEGVSGPKYDDWLGTRHELDTIVDTADLGPDSLRNKVVGIGISEKTLAIASQSTVVAIDLEEPERISSRWQRLKVISGLPILVLPSGDLLVNVVAGGRPEVVRLDRSASELPDNRLSENPPNQVSKGTSVTRFGRTARPLRIQDDGSQVRVEDDTGALAGCNLVWTHSGPILHRVRSEANEVTLLANLNDPRWVVVPDGLAPKSIQADLWGQIAVGRRENPSESGNVMVSIPERGIQKVLDGHWDRAMLSASGRVLVLSMLLGVNRTSPLGERLSLVRVIDPQSPEEAVWEREMPGDSDPVPVAWFNKDESYGFGSFGWIRLADGAAFIHTDGWQCGPSAYDSRRGSYSYGGGRSLIVDLESEPRTRVTASLDSGRGLVGYWRKVSIQECTVHGLRAGDGAYCGANGSEVVVGPDPFVSENPWDARLNLSNGSFFVVFTEHGVDVRSFYFDSDASFNLVSI